MDDRRIGIAELREQQRENWPQAYRDCQPSILRLLRSADDYLRAGSEQLASHNLLPAEFDVLAALRRQPPPHCVSPTALCKALLMSSGGLTKLLKRLETAGNGWSHAWWRQEWLSGDCWWRAVAVAKL